MTSIRRAAAAAAAALSLTAALAACADSTTDSTTDGPTEAAAPGTTRGTTQNSASRTSDDPGTTPSVDTGSATTPGAGSGSTPAAPTGAGTALSKIVLQRADVPSRFHVTGEAHPAEPDAGEGALHRCTGVPATSSARLEAYVSPSYSTVTSGISSATSRYRSQAPVTAEAALLRSPKAKQCFTTYLRAQAVKFYDGEMPVSSTMTVLPGTNDGPSNEAGIVSGTFTFKGNSGSPVDFTIGMYYFTGPRLLTQLLLLGFGADVPDDTQATPVEALARRTAAG